MKKLRIATALIAALVIIYYTIANRPKNPDANDQPEDSAMVPLAIFARSQNSSTEGNVKASSVDSKAKDSEINEAANESDSGYVYFTDQATGHRQAVKIMGEDEAKELISSRAYENPELEFNALPEFLFRSPENTSLTGFFRSEKGEFEMRMYYNEEKGPSEFSCIYVKSKGVFKFDSGDIAIRGNENGYALINIKNDLILRMVSAMPGLNVVAYVSAFEKRGPDWVEFAKFQAEKTEEQSLFKNCK